MATVQQGETPWVATGRTFGRGGDSQSVFSRESVGLMVSATTRIADDGRILIELAVERSRLKPQQQREAPADSDAREQTPSSTETLMLRSTVRVPDGGTVVAQATETRAGNANTHQIVLVSARATERGRKTARPEQRKQDALRAFVLKQVAAASAGSLLKDVYRDRKELRIEVDPRSQSLIVSGPRELLDEIGDLLQKLDAQPPEKAPPKKKS